MGPSQNDPETKGRLEAFERGLKNLGWDQGRNVHLDVRYAVAGSNAQILAKELIALGSDVLLANSTPMAAAFKQETGTLPIVFVSVSDPIGSGFVASIARPLGNMTGLLLYEDGIAGKWLAMLKEVAPALSRAAVIGNPKGTPYDYFLRSISASARMLAIEIVPLRVESIADIQRSLNEFGRTPGGGLIAPPDTFNTEHRDLLIELAARHRMPAIYSLRTFVEGGGLMSYGTSRVDHFGRAAFYVDRILRGAKPADLPVEAPTRYEMVINNRTAKALGLNVPLTLQASADEVIE